MALLDVFFWNILTATCVGFALSAIGVQFFLRSQSLRPLSISQLSIFIFLVLDSLNQHSVFLSPIGGYEPPQRVFLAAVFLVIVIEAIVDFFIKRRTSRELRARIETPLFVYLALTGLTHWFHEVFEVHHSPLDFLSHRSVMSLTKPECFLMMGLSFFSGLFLLPFWKRMTLGGFFSALGHEVPKGLNLEVINRIWRVTSLTALCLFTLNFGQIWTLSIMFIPSQFLGLMGIRGHRLFVFLCLFVGSMGPLIGFLLSVKFESWPTTSSTILVTIFLSFVLGMLAKVKGARGDFKT